MKISKAKKHKEKKNNKKLKMISWPGKEKFSYVPDA